jgi:hypothetical protein
MPWYKRYYSKEDLIAERDRKMRKEFEALCDAMEQPGEEALSVFADKIGDIVYFLYLPPDSSDRYLSFVSRHRYEPASQPHAKLYRVVASRKKRKRK